jgi:hypothetical protein
MHRMFGQEHGNPSLREKMTNLDVMRSLAEEMALEVVRSANSESGAKISISVFPKETAWYIENAIVNGMKREASMIVGDSVATIAANFGIVSGWVAYSNIRRDGFFGEKLADRTVGLRLTSRLTKAGTILWSGDVEKSATDTMLVDDIQNLESPTIPMTRGALPSEGFFSHVAEPLILIGSIAVAVLLLFNVRS